MNLSVVIITFNEEANLARTLESVRPLVAEGKGEIIVVDSGSIDRTVEIAKSYGAKVFVEEWKGYAAQKNSAIDKATGHWILCLDADEEVEQPLAMEIADLFPSTRPNKAELLEQAKQSRYILTRKSVREFKKLAKEKGLTEGIATVTGFWISRKNEFLGHWIRHGGFWPDAKMRLFRRGMARFEERPVHEDAKLVDGISGRLRGAFIHHSYPTLSDYIEHMNRYSSLGAEMVVAKQNGKVRFSVINIVLRPLATFFYNYLFRLGFLDGREGLMLHLYHAVYVSWKYAKAWELANKPKQTARNSHSSS